MKPIRCDHCGIELLEEEEKLRLCISCVNDGKIAKALIELTE